MSVKAICLALGGRRDFLPLSFVGINEQKLID